MIASLLTNSLKKRAKALHLPLPWTAQRTPEGRTRWRDRDGIAPETDLVHLTRA